ncbi:dihydrolipoamide acetyltransferase family protein [Arthrobacter sedimenti]|uniref:dihydrolipoamide acetyltransferase family protein n=1 Tax=Arthrobacter sedimenti TaxID=2694931 RepID=UPI000B350716|nr:dihydrolipoamide acetyltransferase family protein [Arthrobacter sedimenti]OUM39424.1 branched-chain alpha-keto acid dehydrogenase subunit E2 [Arthrobacter agilis]
MSKPNVFLLPDLGEGLTEAELVTWLVSVGDHIGVDQPIAEVETAKSLVEVPSPYAGTVAVLHGEPGQTLDVGKPLISVTATGIPSPSAGSQAPDESALPAADAAATAYREEEKAGSGNVLIGYGTPGSLGQARRGRPRKAPIADAPSPTAAPSVSEKRTAVSSPLVRRLAHDNGIELHTLRGTGTAGLVTRRDVEAAIAARPDAARGLATPDASAATAPAPATASGKDVDSRTGLAVISRTPVKGVRKAVAANMSRSRTEIPEATVWVDVDATALVELRSEMKKRNPEDTPGLLAFIARFVTSGLKKYPELNTRFQDAPDGGGSDSKEIIGFDGINLGFAAQTERGLVVPSIRAADKLSARELDVEIRRLSQVAREGKATPAELGSSTFTLNNYGVFGVDGSAAIINYPEAAILGVGRIIDRPWVVNGELAVRKVVELTLVFDHRVCDGGTAGGFLRHVADAIESPASALADL